MEPYIEYFHVTPASNLAAIAQTGLRPALGPRSHLAHERTPAVFCFRSWEDTQQALMTWLGDEFEPEDPDEDLIELVVLRILIPQAQHALLKIENEAFETRIHNNIPSSWLRVHSWQ